MHDAINDRKLEHIRVIRDDAETDRYKHYFDAVRLRHRALPERDLDAIDPSVEFMGKKLAFPLLISCMTGGDHDVVRTVNRNLATAAETCGVAMGVGSQRVMFTNPAARQSFALRDVAPNALLFANLGAVQLNYGFTPAMCREAVEVVEADGLYLHLNPLQEAVQPEGDTNFANLAGKIGEVVEAVDCPVILKEVGSGISKEDVAGVLDYGIRYVDIAGSGGTSWSRIEARRQAESDASVGMLFQDWGIPTPQALAELRQYRDRLTLIASGGIRTGVDMVKAMVLGASLSGVARPFLEPAMASADAVVAAIEKLKREFTIALFLLGAADVAAVEGNLDHLLSPAPWGLES